MKENEEVRKVFSAGYLFEAEHMQYILTEAGIFSRITGASLQTVVGEVISHCNTPEVWVRNEDYEKAKQLIEQEDTELQKKRAQRTD